MDRRARVLLSSRMACPVKNGWDARNATDATNCTCDGADRVGQGSKPTIRPIHSRTAPASCATLEPSRDGTQTPWAMVSLDARTKANPTAAT